jgi:starch phosphorylase
MSETPIALMPPVGSTKDQKTAMTAHALAHSFLDNLFFVQGRSLERATVNDLYMALAHTVRDRLVERWISTVKNYQAQDVRVVCYLSAEFLTGPHLANNLINLGIYDETEQAMRELGLDLNVLIEQEEEPGLGNGGLGRLAACFMDSLASWTFPPSATAFATNTASSISRSATAGRWRPPTNGCAWAIPGRWSGRKTRLK